MADFSTGSGGYGIDDTVWYIRRPRREFECNESYILAVEFRKPTALHPSGISYLLGTGWHKEPKDLYRTEQEAQAVCDKLNADRRKKRKVS